MRKKLIIFLSIIFLFFNNSVIYCQYTNIIAQDPPGGSSCRVQIKYNAEGCHTLFRVWCLSFPNDSIHVGEYSDNVERTAMIIFTGLIPSTYYRIDATMRYYGIGVNHLPCKYDGMTGLPIGLESIFIGDFTTPAAPIATTDPANNITTSAARLNGKVNPNNVGAMGQFVNVYFDYGLTSDHSDTINMGTIDASSLVEQAFFSDIGGLSPYTTYHYRIRAVYSAGGITDYGIDKTFRTLPVPPTITTQPVTLIWTDTAVGNGNITNLGAPNPTQHGVVWNTAGNPTVNDNKKNNGAAGATGAFTSNITGLLPGTTYYVKAYAINLADTVYGGQVSFTTLKLPTVTTQAVTSVTTTTTEGNGNITDLGNPNPTQHGIVWNTAGNPTTLDSKTTDGAAGATGAFISNITGLTPGVKYYVRAYATNIVGTSYGAQDSFIALKIPTITTQAISGILMTSATGNGNITDLGVPNPTQYGVVWNTTGNPTTADSKTTEGAAGATGAFTSNITGLAPGTTYFVKAYATNTVNTAYGAEVSFTTLKLPTVTTQAVTSITTNSAIGNGNITDLGVPNPTQYGVVWNNTGNPTTADSKTTQGAIGATGAFTSNITGLSPGITYYVKAYATNTAGTSYGVQQIFTTLVTISGTFLWNGNPLGGVSISCNGGAPVVTGADGKYSFDAATGGTYTLVPVKLGFSFGIIQVTLNNVILNTIQNFTALEHPLIYVNPNPVDFQNTGHLTEYKTKTVNINNPSLTKKLLINKFRFKDENSPFEFVRLVYEVPAQGTDSIIIRIKTENLGNYNNIIYVENNSINDTIASVILSGNVITPNLIITPTIVYFDTTTVNRVADTVIIKIKNNTSNLGRTVLSAISITGKEITGDTNSFHIISNSQNITLGGGQIDQVPVEFFPRSTGLKNGTLVISNNDPFSPKIFVRMIGVGAGSPRIYSSQTDINFGVIGYGEKKDTTLIIGNFGNITMNLKGITLAGEEKASYSIVKSEKSVFEYSQIDTLKVHYHGILPVGENKARIEISSDDPLQNPYTINLSGYLKTPLLYKPMLRIYFNNTILGNYFDTTINIKNIGNNLLKTSKIFIDGDYSNDFACYTEIKDLSPGEELPIKVRFKPIGTGNRYSRVAIKSNDPIFKETAIIIIGDGLPASALSVPVQVYPKHKEQKIMTTLTFKWNNVKNAGTYIFELYKDSNRIQKMILKDSTLIDTMKMVSGLKTNQTYCWKVKAKNDYSESDWTMTCNFMTYNRPPTSVLLMNPKPEETVELFYPTKPVKFTWGKSNDPDEEDKVKYSIFIEGNNYNYNNINQIDTLIVLDVMSNLQKASSYNWYVEVTDGKDTTRSEKRMFKTSDKINGIVNEKSQITKYELKQNYPNPFNPSTMIGYQLLSDSYVVLKIYDLMGREVASLISEKQSAGCYEVTWSAIGVPSGMYYYKITAGVFSEMKKLLLLK